MSEHAKYSPSQLHRVIECPGSVALTADEPEETTNYAEEGTMLHKAIEQLIKTNTLPELTKEQARACEEAFDYYDAVLKEASLDQVVSIDLEARTNLAYLNLPECYGIADVIIRTSSTLHVLDWKFGQGVEVHVKDNPQFMAYAVGACSSVQELLAYDKIVTHVVQPRINNMYAHEYAPQQLLLWVEETLRPAITSAENNGPCKAGLKQCQWCKAKYKCVARYDLAKKTAEQVFAMYARPSIDDDDLADLLAKAPFLEKYLSELKSHVFDRCLSGQGFPGYKVVCGRTSRAWKDENAAREWLIAQTDKPGAPFTFEDLYESKFVSPPKAEKLAKGLKKDKDFAALIVTHPGKPTLVPSSDLRGEYSAPNVWSAYVS